MPLNFILKFEMHCHGKFLLNFYSLWKCVYKLLKLLTWKKSNYELCFLWQGCHIEAPASPRVMGLAHPLHHLMGNNVTRMKQSIWLPCEMCHLALVVEIETSVCLPTILWCFALKWHFFLIWNVASYAVTSLPCWQVCQGRIRLAQIMKSNRSSTYPEPWQDHYLRNTVPTQPRGFSLWCSTPQL